MYVAEYIGKPFIEHITHIIAIDLDYYDFCSCFTAICYKRNKIKFCFSTVVDKSRIFA